MRKAGRINRPFYFFGLHMTVTWSPPLLAFPSKTFRHGNKNTLSLFYVIFSAFNKDTNLILNKYVADIQLPGNVIRLLFCMAWQQ
jgi:hypothetical protein